MKLVTPKQMNEIDSLSISKFGIPSVVLMENAALKVVEEIEESLGQLYKKRIFIFAGKGNNGGDGFAAARHLHNKGCNVEVYTICESKSITGDAKINLDILENMGIKLTHIAHDAQLADLKHRLQGADLIVDGIFGTGLRGKVQGLAEEMIKSINESEIYTISIDIPSGVDGLTGEVHGVCVRAHKTVTFALPKIGTAIHPSCEYTGQLVVADISIPKNAVDGLNIKTNLIEKEYVSKLIPRRCSNSNKGDFGRIFVLSGSKGMTGAGILTAKAVLRTGAGLVYIGVPGTLTDIYDMGVTEAVTVPLEDNKSGCLTKESISAIMNRLKNITVAAVGPGLSVNDDITEIIRNIIIKSDIPIVLDADALNAISKDVTILKQLKMPAVITPHPGEMARLAGITNTEVQNNRIEVACEFSKQWKVITVLKGSRTVVAYPDGTLYINCTGNSGMATAGSGDVLTGLITGLIAQGAEPQDAAVAGVYLHGLAGDSAVEDKGEYGLLAGDIVEKIPYAIKGVMSFNEGKRNNVNRSHNY